MAAASPAVTVLAHADDTSALRVHAALRRRLGPGGVALVAVEEVTLAPRWAHRLGTPDDTTEIRLADGRRLRDPGGGAVFNRVRWVPMPHFGRAKAADRDYAAAEMHALLLSWLASLSGAVFNRPSARGLAGAQRSPAEWLALAARAGLPARGIEIGSSARALTRRDWPAQPAAVDPSGGLGPAAPPVPQLLLGRRPGLALEPVRGPARRALVVGDRVLGPAAAAWEAACLRLARAAGCALLELTFARRADGRDCVAAATSLPTLRRAEEVEAVAALLAAAAA